MTMTEEEVHQFNKVGAVTLNTPLTAQEIADAAAALDRLLPFDGRNPRPSRTCDYYDPALLAIIQHPFFEETARRVLGAPSVHFFQTAILVAYPEPNTPFSFWQHVDIQYRLRDFQAVPRNILCSFFLWLSDVNEKRAPMMVRPGSHLLLAEYRENDPAWEGDPPRVAPVPLANLPALPYADPVPLTATAGQVSVLTTATVHGASVNVDSEPRRNFVLTFTATDVTIALPAGEEAQKREYHRELRARLRPERTHIIPAPNRA
jgi:ectoine hydroxylase-related dioxygenase (phytanoyl-CoA dioxygenase family)